MLSSDAQVTLHARRRPLDGVVQRPEQLQEVEGWFAWEGSGHRGNRLQGGSEDQRARHAESIDFDNGSHPILHREPRLRVKADMGSEERVYFRVVDDAVVARARLAGLSVTGEDWALAPVDDEGSARTLSLLLSTPTVWWSIHTVTDQVWLKCFEAGHVVREIRVSAAEGWAADEGTPRGFEAPALAAWKERRPLASPDGYAVLECFLGRSKPPHEVRTSAVDHDGPTTTFSFFLPLALVTEVSRAGLPLATVLSAAWSTGKHRLIARERAHLTEPLRLGDEKASPLFEHEGEARESLLLLPQVECTLTLSSTVFDELAQVHRALDWPMSWVLREAYFLARSAASWR